VKSVYPSARVIAIGTQAALEAARRSTVAADVDSFLEKPVSREALLAALVRSASRTGW
jgi:CheY-like chemotaxis protein